MEPLPIAHVGVLVADLETSRARWAAALGMPFSPIVRYRSTAWSDLADPAPHPNDLRQTIYLGANPSIEIQEFAGNGTHARTKGEGGHHLGFPPVPDNQARRQELAGLGVGIDGEVRHDGRWIIQFTDSRALNNVSTEWVEASPGHLDLKDDGSPVDQLPDGSQTIFDVETILEFRGERPPSGIAELGLAVADLDASVTSWSAVTGYAFDPSPDGGSSAVSRGIAPAVRLVETTTPSAREGLCYAVIATADIAATRARLERDGVPLAGGTLASSEGADVSPGYLNGFSIRFRHTGG
jgi:catechol 2,3-dioxygenase-like lactoylglutathione lyase family enzyme